MTLRRSLRRLVAAEERATVAAAELGLSEIGGAITMVGKLGDQPELRILSGVTLAAGLLVRNPRLTRVGVRMLIAHEAATFAKDMAKNLVDRTRPRSASRPGDAVPRRGNSRDKEESSFPSGHSAGAVAVACAFAREFPEYRGEALGSAMAVAAAQVPRASHYPSDILAGLALGVGVEALVNAGWNWMGIDQNSKATAVAPANAEASTTAE